MKTNGKSWMEAITFAEAGEWETAKGLVPDKKFSFGDWFETTMIIATMAEEEVYIKELRLEERPENKLELRPMNYPL